MSKVDELLKRGAQQISRKHRTVAVLPEGMTGLDALERYCPEEFERLMQRIEDSAADSYRRSPAAYRNGHQINLTVDQFQEFLQRTGRGGKWRPSGDACEHCKTLGHRHARDCPNG